MICHPLYLPSDLAEAGTHRVFASSGASSLSVVAYEKPFRKVAAEADMLPTPYVAALMTALAPAGLLDLFDGIAARLIGLDRLVIEGRRQ